MQIGYAYRARGHTRKCRPLTDQVRTQRIGPHPLRLRTPGTGQVAEPNTKRNSPEPGLGNVPSVQHATRGLGLNLTARQVTWPTRAI